MGNSVLSSLLETKFIEITKQVRYLEKKVNDFIISKKQQVNCAKRDAAQSAITKDRETLLQKLGMPTSKDRTEAIQTQVAVNNYSSRDLLISKLNGNLGNKKM